MSFGLKNMGATYQRCMQRCLHDDQIGRNIEAYFNDIVVKSAKGEDLIKELSKTFDNLQKFNIKLNPEKCTFGVPAHCLDTSFWCGESKLTKLR